MVSHLISPPLYPRKRGDGFLDARSGRSALDKPPDFCKIAGHTPVFQWAGKTWKNVTQSTKCVMNLMRRTGIGV